MQAVQSKPVELLAVQAVHPEIVAGHERHIPFAAKTQSWSV